MKREKDTKSFKESQDEVFKNSYLYPAAVNIFKNTGKYFDRQYLFELKMLNNIIEDKSNRPSKHKLTDEENHKYDIYRLKYINKAIDFALTYYTSGKSPINKNLTIPEYEFAEILVLSNSRTLLKNIACTVFNLSGRLRDKYKYLLQPKPFIWETFERLGGAMTIASYNKISTDLRLDSIEVYERLHNERKNIEKITEAAIPTIINEDLPKLKILFNHIKSREKGNETDEIQPVRLTAIKVFVQRFLDIENLTQLIRLSSYHSNTYNDMPLAMVERQEKNGKIYYVPKIKDRSARDIKQFDLNTKLGRHAALRYLLMVGELITGKNLSSYLTKLDPSIDWQAFIDIRDVLAHPEEGDSKAKIDNLLDNNNLLRSILYKDIKRFNDKLSQIVLLRDQLLPKFQENNIDEFWQEVYSHEQEISKPAKKEEEFECRTSKENTRIIIDTLRRLNAPNDLMIKWVNIFNGRQKELPTTKDKGELFKIFSVLKMQEPELFSICKNIIDNAISPKPQKKSKTQIMEEHKEAKDRKKIEEEQRFIDLKNIRILVQNLKQKSSICLTRLQKVEAAIEALENIREFMVQEGILKSKRFPTKDGTKYEYDIDSLVIALLSNPIFNNAIEYNAIQLLGFLDKIHKFPEASGKQYLSDDYELTRSLRNYVAHGNYLIDRKSYDPDNPDGCSLTERQKAIAPIMIILLEELRPILEDIKEQIKLHKNDMLKAISILLPFSQSLRYPEGLSPLNPYIKGSSNYFSFLPLDVVVNILSFVPEVMVLSSECKNELLGIYSSNKIPPKEDIKKILNSPEQASYRKRVIVERENESKKCKSKDT